MKVVWENSGDELAFVPYNYALADYWISNIQSRNSFFVEKNRLFFDQSVPHLVKDIQTVNEVFKKFKIEFPVLDSIDYLDQNTLNQLHEQWVKLQQKYNMVELLNRLPQNIVEPFNNINHAIHQIELNTYIRYNSATNANKTFQMPNTFDPDILKFGVWQLELQYQNLGRSTYEKWAHYDKNFDDTDTNNFSHIGGVVVFNIARPYESSPPKQYVEYCVMKGIEPYGEVLPLGNFTDNITTVRQVFYKNVYVAQNNLSFHLT